MRVVLLVNPAAGGGEALARARELCLLLEPLGHVEPVTTRSISELTSAARSAAAAGHTIVVAGGDGSVQQIVNAIDGAPVPVGVLPSGSGNDLARALGLPLDVRAAAARIAAGRTRLIDLAEVNGRLFCTVGGIGLVARTTADIARLTGPRSMLRVPLRWLGGTAYLISAGVRILLASSLEQVRMTGDGPSGEWSWQGAAHAVFVANQPTLGAGLSLPVPAAADDGVLEVCVVPRRGRVSLARKLAALRTGHPQPSDVLRVERAVAVRIELERAAPFAADGEILFEGQSFVVRVRPSALQMLV